jgi:ABC-type sulfate/molybdate transport systems ATPase subunit
MSEGDLSIDELRTSLGRFALGPVTSLIPAGTITALIGPNGAGKTTLVRSIAGLHPIEAGRIRWGSEEISTLPAERRRLGYVPAGLGLLPHRSVEANVAYAATLRGDRTAHASARRWIAKVGLTGREDAYPRQLSSGERQRVALARALAAEPRLLLLDEPLASIDIAGREELVALLRLLVRTEALPVLLVAHEPETVWGLADRVHLLENGRSRFDGPLDRFLDRPVDRFVARFQGLENLLAPMDVGGLPRGSRLRAVLEGRSGPAGVAFGSSAVEVAPATSDESPGELARLRSYRSVGKRSLLIVEAHGVRLLGEWTRPGSLPSAGDPVRVNLIAEEIYPLAPQGGEDVPGTLDDPSRS